MMMAWQNSLKMSSLQDPGKNCVMYIRNDIVAMYRNKEQGGRRHVLQEASAHCRRSGIDYPTTHTLTHTHRGGGGYEQGE